MTDSQALEFVDELPNGAQWYRCAFQVNPYGYVQTQRRPAASSYADEESYNTALIAALKKTGIQVIGITDHWNVSSGERLRKDALAASP
jgi:hypothetical protein